MLKLVSVLAAGLVGMGGWAVVSIQELPEYFVAGRPYTIEFKSASTAGICSTISSLL